MNQHLPPAEWTTVTVGELLKRKWLLDHMDGNHGSDYPKNEEFVEAGVPYIAANAIQLGQVNLRLARYLSPTRAAKLRKGFARDGDVLFAHNATVGPVALLKTTERQIILGTSLTYFRCDPRHLDPGYLKSFLESQHFVCQYQRMMGQSTRNQVPISAQRKFACIVPPIAEQRLIARLLSTWDDGIRQLSESVAAKVRFKRGLMQQLLTGKRQFPKFKATTFVERHVSDVLKETPRPVKWNDAELYRLASIRRNSGGLFWREALLGKHIKVKKLHSLCKGDFLISHIQAAYGAMGLVPKEFEGGTVSDMYTILTPRVEDTIDMRYIDYLSQMRRMRHQAYLACNGFFAERLRLNFDPAEFLKQKILLPATLAEQTRIADLLDTLVSEIETLKRELDALQTQKKGLMQTLLTGQVRVNP